MAGRGAGFGNKNAAKGKLFLAQLKSIIVDEEHKLPLAKRRLRKAADKLLSEAARGEEWAIKELANRLDGRAVQGVELGLDEGTIDFFSESALRDMAPAKLDQLQSLLKEAGALIPEVIEADDL